jgi:DNA-nicking Smr family endonuclease
MVVMARVRAGGRPPADPDEESLFADAMRGVRPLDRRSGPIVIPEPDAPPGAPPSRPSPPSAAARLETIELWGERYALLAPGIDRRLLRELARPLPPPDATVDLHGMNAARARRALRAFVSSAQSQGCRRLLVIHGRGHRSGPAGPVLRDCVLDELAGALAASVLAVVTAPPALGGPGAALILLRRPR